MRSLKIVNGVQSYRIFYCELVFRRFCTGGKQERRGKRVEGRNEIAVRIHKAFQGKERSLKNEK